MTPDTRVPVGLLRRTVLAALGGVAGPAVVAGRAWAQKPKETHPMIPFRFLQDSTVMITASIAGRSANVMLDTGASTTLVSRQLAGALGWPGGSTQVLRGNSGKAAAARGEALSLSIGGAEVASPTTVVLDLDLIASSVGAPIDVVLGKHLFDTTMVELDFPNRRLAVGPDLWPTSAPGTVLTVRTGPHGERLVEAQVEGHPPAPAVFDLGSSSALMLSKAYAESAGLWAGKRTSTAAIGGVDGMEISTSVVIAEIGFAGTVLHRLPAEVLTNWLSPDFAISIGLPVLSRFHMVCDFANNRVHLRADPGALTAPFAKDHAGVGVSLQPDRLVVVHVAANGPAATAKLQNGDQIVAIDDHRIGNDYLTSDLWRWRNAPAGRRVKLTLANGEDRWLVTADYY
jgi:predicted aspartyl protease